MGAVSVDLARAVANELAEAPPENFGQQLRPVRAYAPTFELEELQKLRISVAPREQITAIAGRKAQEEDLVIDVAVQQRVETEDLTKIDALVLLCDQIADYMAWRPLAGFPIATRVETRRQPLYDATALREKRVFLGGESDGLPGARDCIARGIEREIRHPSHRRPRQASREPRPPRWPPGSPDRQWRGDQHAEPTSRPLCTRDHT